MIFWSVVADGLNSNQRREASRGSKKMLCRPWRTSASSVTVCGVRGVGDFWWGCAPCGGGPRRHAKIHAHASTCVRACMHPQTVMSAYLPTFAHVYLPSHTCIRTYVPAYVTYRHTQAHVHACIPVYLHATQRHTCMHAYMHASMHVCTLNFTWMHACMRGRFEPLQISCKCL